MLVVAGVDGGLDFLLLLEEAAVGGVILEHEFEEFEGGVVIFVEVELADAFFVDSLQLFFEGFAVGVSCLA